LVTANGAPALAATLRDLALTLPWFVEQAFAKALGPVIGQRVADAGRRLLAFPEYAVDRVSESVGSYARDEADLLARGDEARAFAQENAALAARVDALAPRLDALAARLTAAAAPAAGSNP
jgi:ubiquinone biosynthesis protein UbiJ